MSATAKARRTRILLASTSSVDRAVMEADLLHFFYDVETAGNVEEALEIAEATDVDVIVTDLGLSGGGGFSLCRAVNSNERDVPAIAVAPRQVDAEVRRMGNECGVRSFLELPVASGQLRAVIERLLAHALRSNHRQRAHRLQGDIATWSVADVVRYMEHFAWSGDAAFKGLEESGSLHFRDGTLTSAERSGHLGERALVPMLSWRAGTFTLEHEPVEGPSGPRVRPPRNIHRSTTDVLVDGLARAVARERFMKGLPGLELPQRLDPRRARELGMETELIQRLAEALDGRRTLGEALHAAEADDEAHLRQVRRLVEAGAIRPVTGVVGPPEPEPEPPKPFLEQLPVGDTSGTYERQGATVRRKLSLRSTSSSGAGKVERFSEFDDPDVVRRKRRKQVITLTWLSIGAVLLALLIGYYVSRSPDEGVEVRVIDDVPAETR